MEAVCNTDDADSSDLSLDLLRRQESKSNSDEDDLRSRKDGEEPKLDRQTSKEEGGCLHEQATSTSTEEKSEAEALGCDTAEVQEWQYTRTLSLNRCTKHR